MSPIAVSLVESLTTIILQKWLAWVVKQQRPEGWKPSEADIAGFLADLDSDTPEKIREEARKEIEGRS